jgi:hypothetical protein
MRAMPFSENLTSTMRADKAFFGLPRNFLFARITADKATTNKVARITGDGNSGTTPLASVLTSQKSLLVEQEFV